MTARRPLAPRLRAFVRAAALEPAPARAAWQEWRSTAGDGRLRPAEEQIAAAVNWNLAQCGVSRGELEPLAPYFNRAQLLYRIRASGYATVLAQLAAHGIEPLVLKGQAIGRLYYDNPGVRRSGDLDVLVPETDFATAMNVLRDAGWEGVTSDGEAFNPRFQHAAQLLDERGLSVGLHCHALVVSCRPGSDRFFLEGARGMTLHDRQVGTLCATDHLLHVAVHGQIAVPVRPVRWMVDAAAILRRAADELDWDRLVAVARHMRVTAFLLVAFRELRATLDLEPPAPVLAATTLRTGIAERALLRATAVTPRGPLDAVRWHLGTFLHGTDGMSLVRRAFLVPAYLRAWLGTAGWLRLMGRLLWRTARSLAVRLRLLSPSVVLNRRTMGSDPDALRARLGSSGQWSAR